MEKAFPTPEYPAKQRKVDYGRGRVKTTSSTFRTPGHATTRGAQPLWLVAGNCVDRRPSLAALSSLSSESSSLTGRLSSSLDALRLLVIYREKGRNVSITPLKSTGFGERGDKKTYP